MDPAIVRETLGDPDFLLYAEEARNDPERITPKKSEIIARLYMEAEEAPSSRDRQSALRGLLELTE
jgi:hypothetical protein